MPPRPPPETQQETQHERDRPPAPLALVLGGGAAEGTGCTLAERDLHLDRALGALYDSDRKGGLGASAPSVPRWLGDIRDYFPASVVQVMQRDAFERLDLKRMLTEPEMLEAVQPDVNLVSTLISLRGLLGGRTKETARLVVRKVVDALMKRLEEPVRQAVAGAIDRASLNRRPRHAEIDWHRTIRRTCATTRPNTAPSSRRRGWATAAGAAARSRT